MLRCLLLLTWIKIIRWLFSSDKKCTIQVDQWAPKKHMLYLCRIQTPPPETLQEEWVLESGGVWGYAFNYNANELCFYHLEKGETFGPLTLKATLTLTDWSVLSLVCLNELLVQQQMEVPEPIQQAKTAEKQMQTVVKEEVSLPSLSLRHL